MSTPKYVIVYQNVNMERNGKISWTEHNNKLRIAGNDWRRENPDTDTKKETKEMEPRKRQKKWNGHTCTCIVGCHFYKYFYFISLYALVSSFDLHFPFLIKKPRNWS